MRELALHILDIAENSAAAGAGSVLIEVRESRAGDRLLIRVSDDGRGIDAGLKEKDPFYTSKCDKSYGLGIPLLRQAAEQCEGSFRIGPRPGGGTEVVVEFRLGHMDRMPLGDIGSTAAAFVGGHPEVDLEVVMATGDDEYRFSTKELRKELEGLPLNVPQVLEYIRQEITEAGRRHDG
jgi:anti-sigma regulatory factor (Ser/Thr protein kinase)